MSLPNDYPNGLLVPGVIVSRGDKTNDPGGAADGTQTNMCQVALIGRHNFPTQVPLSHLPLSTFSKPPTGGAQDTIEPAPDKGTTIMANHQTGRSDVVIAGQFSDLNESSSGTPGNMNLMGMFQTIMSQTDGRRAAPDFKEVMKNGAKIREIVEKGFDHSHSKLAGLPTHGAIQSLLKVLPPVKEIPTAVQKFSQILTEAMAGGMPGKTASPGMMFSGIQNNPAMMQKIQQSLPPNLVEAFNSIATLAQHGTTLDNGGDISGMRVHEDTFMQNAVDLLSQAKSIDDLVTAGREMMSNTQLHGLDKLANTTFNFETPYGNNTLHLTGTGELTEVIDANTANVQAAFTEQMTSGGGAPTGTGGAGGGKKNLFGDSMKTMLQMYERLNPQEHKKAQQLLQKVNARSLKNKLNPASEKTVMGQTPFTFG